MQLIVKHSVEGGLRLPINYHHFLQSAIYHNLCSDIGYSDFVHDRGYQNHSRVFKMFSFGPIRGKYSIEGKEIVFHENISFEIRTPDVLMVQILQDNIARKGLHYLNRQFKNVNVTRFDRTVEAEEIRIKMFSPICVYSTDDATGKTVYYSPEDARFAELINANFRRKYRAYYGTEPESDIEILPLELGSKDKYVTQYKGIYITAWKGKYVLKGKRKYLDFLYQAGIGSKNAQGFGMFEVMSE